LDRDAVVHLVDAKDLSFAAVAAELVIFAHDQRLDRFGRADFRTQSTEAAAGEIEVEVVEHFDLDARLAVPPEGDQIVWTRLRALIAHDAGLRAGRGLGLQPQHTAESRRGRPPFGRVLESERR